MRDEIELRWSGMHPLDRHFAAGQTGDLFEREHVCAADIPIRIGRREAIEVRATHCCENEQIRMVTDSLANRLRYFDHRALTLTIDLRALSRNAFARSASGR